MVHEVVDGTAVTLGGFVDKGQPTVRDGHDATRRIRLELNLADLPIIALTAGALSSERQRATAAGMDDYLVKPFDAQSLVTSILRRAAIAASPDAPAPEALPWPQIEGIDGVDVRERLGNDFGLFRSMLKRLLDKFSDVSIPIAGQAPTNLAVHAGRMHKLRGSAGILGAKGIHQLAGEAEAACAAGNVERSVHLATRLAVMVQRLGECAAPLVATVPAQAGDPSEATASTALEQELVRTGSSAHRQPAVQ